MPYCETGSGYRVTVNPTANTFGVGISKRVAMSAPREGYSPHARGWLDNPLALKAVPTCTGTINTE